MYNYLALIIAKIISLRSIYLLCQNCNVYVWLKGTLVFFFRSLVRSVFVYKFAAHSATYSVSSFLFKLVYTYEKYGSFSGLKLSKK